MCDFISFWANKTGSDIGERYVFSPSLTSHSETFANAQVVQEAKGLPPLNEAEWAQCEWTGDQPSSLSVRCYEKSRGGNDADGTANMIKAAIISRWPTRSKLLAELTAAGCTAAQTGGRLSESDQYRKDLTEAEKSRNKHRNEVDAAFTKMTEDRKAAAVAALPELQAIITAINAAIDKVPGIGDQRAKELIRSISYNVGTAACTGDEWSAICIKYYADREAAVQKDNNEKADDYNRTFGYFILPLVKFFERVAKVANPLPKSLNV